MQKTLRAMLNTIEESWNAMVQDEDSSPHRMVVELASNAEVGWDKLRYGSFDLALIDVTRSGGPSGVELSQAYQMLAAASVAAPDDSGRRETVLIACTSDPNVSVETLQPFGIHDLLRKPVAMQSLRHTLHKWLPRAGDATADPLVPLTPLSPASPQNPAPAIMLVEDDEITRNSMELLFNQLNLQLDTAESGEEAIAVLERREYDLLIFEVNLPRMSGYALSSWYKELCRTRQRPAGFVVAVTADPDEEACRQFEFDRCLPKPISSQRIVDLVSRFVRQRVESIRRRSKEAADLAACDEMDASGVGEQTSRPTSVR